MSVFWRSVLGRSIVLCGAISQEVGMQLKKIINPKDLGDGAVVVSVQVQAIGMESGSTAVETSSYLFDSVPYDVYMRMLVILKMLLLPSEDIEKILDEEDTQTE